MKRFVLFIATGFGLGLVAPFAPGTFGSLPGVALSYGVMALPFLLQPIVALVLVLAAIPFCDVAEKVLGVKDDGRITADEWMLYPLAVLGLPLADLPWWSMIIFFVVTRTLDIVKPYPARKLQEIPGGRGIVIDDFFANLYSLGVNWAIYLIFFR